MDSNDNILNELVVIRKMLTILSQEKLENFNEQIRIKFLTTEQRQKMYDLFDGTKSFKQIGDEIRTTSEAVRLFAVSLEKAGLLEYVTDTKSKCPKRLF